MWCKIRRFFSLFLLLGALILFGLGIFNTPPATAAISTLEEAPGQVLYQSRHKLRDNRRNTWQVVLFKRMKVDDSPSINLRFVAFPGTVDFAHPQPLKITTKMGKNFNAEDIFAQQAPANNVGQYDIKNVLNQLPTSASINLSVAMKDNQIVELQIPPEVILEWQTIAAQ